MRLPVAHPTRSPPRAHDELVGSCRQEDHERAKRSDAAWLAMTFVGFMPKPATTLSPATTLELRNCPCCGSTLARRQAS